MFTQMKEKAKYGVYALAATPLLASAQVDVTDATGALGDVGTAVGLIGLAMVAAISAGIAYRWIVAFLAK
jgi:hypothetical protein